MALPSNVSFGTVIGTFLLASADSPADPDRDPEGTAATDLTFTFAPDLSPAAARDASASPPTMFALLPVSATVGQDGSLLGPDGAPGVRLVASTNPSLQPTGWTWRVKLKSNTFPEMSFSFLLDPGATVDLSTVLQVPANPGGTLNAWLQAVADAQTARDAAVAAAASVPSRAELMATYFPFWKSSTAYTVGQLVLNPSGQNVQCSTAHTSGSSYDASKWTVVAGGTAGIPVPSGTPTVGQLLGVTGTGPTVFGLVDTQTITKSDLGLGSVDNTSDATKPVSTAQATADSVVQAYAVQRAHHTGTQTSDTISDLLEAVQDAIFSTFRAGTNVTTSYDDAAGTFTINASGGGAGTTDPEVVRDTIGGALVGGANIQVTVNDAADSITIAVTGLATVATSGAYGDLTGKPTLGTAAAQDATAFDPAGSAAAAQTAAVQRSANPITAPSGAWQYPCNYIASGAIAITAGTVYYVPFDVGPNAGSFNALGVNVGTAEVGGATTTTLGVYPDNGTGGRPNLVGGPIVSGTVALTAVGNPILTAVTWNPAPGRYWLAFLYSVTTAATTVPQLYCISSAVGGFSSAIGSSAMRGLQSTGQTALPTTQVTVSPLATQSAPLVCARAA